MLNLMKAVTNSDDVRDYMRDVDRTLLRENLKLTFEQRAQKHLRALQMVEDLRRAGKKKTETEVQWPLIWRRSFPLVRKTKRS
jgi:hypothetical protein